MKIIVYWPIINSILTHNSTDNGDLCQPECEQIQNISGCNDDSSDDNFVPDSSDEDYWNMSSTDEEQLIGEAEEQTNISESLASWVVKYKVPCDGTNELLDIFRQHGHCVPADTHTLLNTPLTCNVQDKCNWKYIYFGLETGVRKLLAQNPSFCAKNDRIQLQVNIDGIPLFKSKNESMWPILCSFDEFNPFIVAIFSGGSKPGSIADYLEDFLEEYVHLQLDHIMYNNKQFYICI